MAGLGRKEFNAGDILLASEVQGYLQDQAVMVFDDSTARGSAIPSPSEGMLTYNKATDQLELYDGSAFAPVGSDSGLIHINTTSFSAVASQSINNVFSATYDNYRIVMYYEPTTSINAIFDMRLRASGSDNSASNSYRIQYLRANVTSVSAAGGLDNKMFMGENSGTGGFRNNISMDIFSPFLASPTNLNNFNMSSRDSMYLYLFNGGHNVASSFDGFSFLFSSATTGTISIYGYAKV